MYTYIHTHKTFLSSYIFTQVCKNLTEMINLLNLTNSVFKLNRNSFVFQGK